MTGWCLRLWFLRFILSIAIYFSECAFFLAVETATGRCVLLCLFSNRYLKIWSSVLLLTLSYNLTDLSVSQRMHMEGDYSKDFYAGCLLSLWYSWQFSDQLRDGRSGIASKGEIPSLNKHIKESLYLSLASPFPCCFRPPLCWAELGAAINSSSWDTPSVWDRFEETETRHW